jgi:hypothetical protein
MPGFFFMHYTYETQWPAPWVQGWRRSKNVYHNLHDAALGLADWLETGLDNDLQIEGRLVALTKKEGQ